MTTDCVIQGQDATGSFVQQGLNVAGRITYVNINDTTWTALPPTPLAGRNTMGLHNFSGQEIKYEYDNSVAGFNGVPVPNGVRLFWVIQDTVTVYAKCTSGTVQVIVEEIA